VVVAHAPKSAAAEPYGALGSSSISSWSPAWRTEVPSSEQRLAITERIAQGRRHQKSQQQFSQTRDGPFLLTNHSQKCLLWTLEDWNDRLDRQM
jgi:hypothetical protein